jgi:hypothetical protein
MKMTQYVDMIMKTFPTTNIKDALSNKQPLFYLFFFTGGPSARGLVRGCPTMELLRDKFGPDGRLSVGAGKGAPPFPAVIKNKKAK